MAEAKTFAQDLASLVAVAQIEVKRLPAAPVKPSIPSRNGIGKGGTKGGDTVGGGNGSIASPLTEQAGKRTYYTTKVSIKSADGMFTVKYNPLKSATFKDANGALVVFNFADPTVV